MRALGIDVVMRQRERAEQPIPHGTLMISAVALVHAPAIAPGVVRIARCEAAQPDRRQELARAGLYDRTGAAGIEQPATEGHCKDLIRSQARIRAAPVRSPRAVRTTHDAVLLVPFPV